MKKNSKNDRVLNRIAQEVRSRLGKTGKNALTFTLRPLNNEDGFSIDGTPLRIRIWTKRGEVTPKLRFYVSNEQRIGTGEKVIGPWLMERLNTNAKAIHVEEPFSKDTLNNNSKEGLIVLFPIECNPFQLEAGDYDSIANVYKKLIDFFGNKNLADYITENKAAILEWNKKYSGTVDAYLNKKMGGNKTSVEDDIRNLIFYNLQVILTGAPGTGKTYTAKQIAAAFVDESLDEHFLGGDANLTDDDKENVLKKVFSNPEKYFPDSKELGSKPDEFKQVVFTDSVQFHPGYDYSDFIIGMKPVLLSKGGKELEMKNGKYVLAGTEETVLDEDIGEAKVSFRWKDGIFKKFAKRAKDAYDKAEDKEKAPRFVFLIDEINRADLSRVFGELFSLLEEEYRYPNGKGTDSILLPNGERFSIPKNLYIIGTMNDIDRSVESMDFALRRRFAWYEVSAESSETIIAKKAEEGTITKDDAEKLIKAMQSVNDLIAPKKSSEQAGASGVETIDLRLGSAYQLGGAIFAKLEKYVGKNDNGEIQGAAPEAFDKLWNNHIKNILSEYLRGRRDRDDLIDTTLKGAYDSAWKGPTGDGPQPAK